MQVCLFYEKHTPQSAVRLLSAVAGVEVIVFEVFGRMMGGGVGYEMRCCCCFLCSTCLHLQAVNSEVWVGGVCDRRGNAAAAACS